MNRREIGKQLAVQSSSGLATASLVAAVSSSLAAAEAREQKVEQSPHVGALELIFQKAADRIRAVDQENWWHDVKERVWLVQRPFAPGSIDSTHLFTVRYQVGGKQVAAWQVDTRHQAVEEIRMEPRKP